METLVKTQGRRTYKPLSTRQKEEIMDEYREEYSVYCLTELYDHLNQELEQFEKDQLKIKVLRELLKDAELEADPEYPED